MSVVVNSLWTEIRIAGGMSNTPESQTVFLAALGRVVDYVNPKWKTDYDVPTAVSGSIDCEDYQRAAFFSGVQHWMQRFGAWAKEPLANSWAVFLSDVHSAITAAITEAIDAGEFPTRTQQSV